MSTKSTKKYEVFDADERDLERTSAGLRFNGKLYRRARRNNKVQRTIRRKGRDQIRLLEEIDEARKIPEVDRLTAKLAETEDADEIAKLEVELKEVRDSVDEDHVDELQDQYEDGLFEVLELLLGEAEDGTRLTAADLADLDIEDAVGLSNELMGINKAEDEQAAANAEEDAEDPT
ncbi:MAG: hypothetical protein ITG02_01210 [Patulibacter sp.]|nr:hypothetical protein [Patulibacter sp.]